MPFKPAATASAIPPRIILRELLRMSSRIRGPGARSSASGRRSIPSSPTFRANSRSRLQERPRIAPLLWSMMSECTSCAAPIGRPWIRNPRWRRSRPDAHHRSSGARLSAARTSAVLSGSGIAGLQPGGTPRQHHTRRASRSSSSPWGSRNSSGVSRPSGNRFAMAALRVDEAEVAARCAASSIRRPTGLS